MTYVVLVDPLGMFKDVPHSELVEACGVLPEWAMSATADQTMDEAMQEAYPWGHSKMQGGDISAKGVFHYPSDPPLYPLMQITRGDETIYFYQYALVGCSLHPSAVVRMD